MEKALSDYLTANLTAAPKALAVKAAPQGGAAAPAAAPASRRRLRQDSGAATQFSVDAQTVDAAQADAIAVRC